MPPPGSFQAFTIKFNGLVDRIITNVTIHPAFDPATTPTIPQGFTTTALWDTGASKSVVSPAVVSALSLAAVGTTQVRHAGGVSTSPRYLVNVGLPNRVVIAGCLVSEFASQDGFEVIIGMDVIGMSDFSVTNVAGRSCMSFRIPSLGLVDYVAEANRIRFAGTHRNAPCPCGRKKPDGQTLKYKHCHGGPTPPPQ